MQLSEVDAVGVDEHRTHHGRGCQADGDVTEPRRTQQAFGDQEVGAGTDDPHYCPDQEQVVRATEREPADLEVVVALQTDDSIG